MHYSAQDILAAFEGAAQSIFVEVVEETGSTNADLMARVQSLHAPTLRVAAKQAAGRGRAGRTWHMEPGKALTFSLAWRFALPLTRLTGLPLVAGVALAESLAAWDIDARLKWPNDVLKNEGKLAGILVEAVADKRDAAHAWAVIGIGLNLDASAELTARIGAPVACAPELASHSERVLGTIVNALAAALVQFEAQGLPAFSARWNRSHAHAGKQVAILDQGKVVHQGTAIGIDDSGRLVLETAAGRVAILSGDVSLRLADHV